MIESRYVPVEERSLLEAGSGAHRKRESVNPTVWSTFYSSARVSVPLAEGKRRTAMHALRRPPWVIFVVGATPLSTRSSASEYRSRAHSYNKYFIDLCYRFSEDH